MLTNLVYPSPRMKLLFPAITALYFTFFTGTVLSSDIVLVANESLSDKSSISALEVRNIFLGIKNNLNGQSIKPVNLSKGKIKNDFNRLILQMSDIELMSHWIKESLAGGSAAPKSLKSVKSVIRYVRKKKGSIAYLSVEDAATSGLIIIKIE